MVKLEGSTLFTRLDAEELQSLRRRAVERTFAPGEEIFKEGDAGDGMYVVRDGLVEISGMVGADVRHVFSRIGPGDFFGEMAVLDDKPRSATAAARAQTRVYFFGR